VSLGCCRTLAAIPSRLPGVPLHDLMREALLDSAAVRSGETRATRQYLTKVRERLGIKPATFTALLIAIGGVDYCARGRAELLEATRRELIAEQRIISASG
jgi:hypothetical protein